MICSKEIIRLASFLRSHRRRVIYHLLTESLDRRNESRLLGELFRQRIIQHPSLQQLGVHIILQVSVIPLFLILELLGLDRLGRLRVARVLDELLGEKVAR